MVKILIKIENINLNTVFLQVINAYSNQILSPTEERLGRAGDFIVSFYSFSQKIILILNLKFFSLNNFSSLNNGNKRHQLKI